MDHIIWRFLENTISKIKRKGLLAEEEAEIRFSNILSCA